MSELTNGLVPQLQAKNAALEARVAELEAAVDELRSYCQRGIEAKERYGDAVYVGSVQSLYNVIRKIDELFPSQTPAAAPVADAPVQEAPQPRFKVGDKVRIKWADYLHGKYEEVEAFDGTVYALKDIPVVFEPFELEAYSESEGE